MKPLHNCKEHPYAPVLVAEGNKCFACWTLSREAAAAPAKAATARSSYFQPNEMKQRAWKMFVKNPIPPSTAEDVLFANDLRMLRD